MKIEVKDCDCHCGFPTCPNFNFKNLKELIPEPYRKLFVVLLLFIIYSIYFFSATYHYLKFDSRIFNFNSTTCTGYGFLVILYVLIVYILLYAYILKPYFVPLLQKHVFEPVSKFAEEYRYVKVSLHIVIYLAFLGFLAWDTSDNRHRFIPIVGLVAFLLFGFLISSNKRKIPWYAVSWGLILQFLFGLLTIRWDVGRNIFECIGDKITSFLMFSNDGSSFVYGDKIVNEYAVFAFKALSTIYFVCFVSNILYHYGIMQKFVSILGEFLQSIMGTSICESVNSAANIFLGLSEAPFLLKPYLKDLTDSEIHSIMTSGFATVSGTVFAAYISYGASSANLITASVMSAPAALCFSKLVYPETEEINVTKESVQTVESEFESVIDAASQGANEAIKIVTGVIASLIAFIAFVAFLDAVLSWHGELIGSDEWTIANIIGKIFIPISYIMGVPWDDCEKVGQLIGFKTIINEFVAFERMSTMELTGRTKTIATFAICGFSNPGSIGITLSVFGALIPAKRNVISRLVFRAFVGGAIVCFMTACVAGALTPDDLI